MSGLKLLVDMGLTRVASGGTPQYGITSVPGSVNTFNTNSQRGPIYEFSVDVTAIGARVYMPSAGAETVRLWQVGSGNPKLAEIEITSVANTWVEGMFASPVNLTKGVSYVIATRRTNNGSRDTVHHGPGDFAFNPLVTFKGGRSEETSTYPSLGHSYLLGLADLIFTV